MPLLFDGAVAQLPLASLVRRPRSAPRLIVEVFAVTVAVIAAVWAGGLGLRLLEQRW